MKKAIRNDYAQPISGLAQNMYQELLKRNERGILDAADPKVTYVLDNNMNVAKFIALGGNDDKNVTENETFTFFGQTIKLPYEKVNYEVADIVTGKVSKASVKYLDTKDTELVAEVYKEFYRLAEFLCSQEVAMRGLLPELNDKGAYIADPKTGIPYVGDGYLQHYFGLTQSASNEMRSYKAAVSDVHRWSFGSFNYQIKASQSLWKSVYDAIKNGDINSYGIGPTIDNIGVTDFKVSNPDVNTSYVSSNTMTERPTYINNNRSDMANVLLDGTSAPTPAPTSAIQPSQTTTTAPTGTIKAKK